ncbi:MAG: VWA domain-containing protein [Chloroflexi bacterium]|nr:VWA domain-containing protein [Chloroflexota bacterium]
MRRAAARTYPPVPVAVAEGLNNLMDESLDPYVVLGVSRTATDEEIYHAYRDAVRRYQPDVNPDPQAVEEFRRITQAYEILSDPARRRENATGEAAPTVAEGTLLSMSLTPSSAILPVLDEPQVVYLLVEISSGAEPTQTGPRPPLNLCLVLDRSTSMQGSRLDQVKAATQSLIDQLSERDTFAVVAFSDRAEVVLPAQTNADKTLAKAKVSTLRASGGTEILQGLIYGLSEVQRFISPAAVNQLILLTDGRTYGDEADCLLLASMAGGDGITVHGLGIGEEWNDAFLDDLAGRTGGSTAYLKSPGAVNQFLRARMQDLSGTYAERLRLEVVPYPGVEMQSAFRLAPQPGPLPLTPQPMRVGGLARAGKIQVILQFLLPPRAPGTFSLARLAALGDVLGAGRVGERVAADLTVEVKPDAPAADPPVSIIKALSKLSIYQMQEKAAAEAAAGKLDSATRRLERLASRLLADGEQALARQALDEAQRLARARQISPEGQKQLKYGTRALISGESPLKKAGE